MNLVRPMLLGCFSIMLLAIQSAAKNPSVGQSGTFTSSDGVRLHYLQAGQEGHSILFVPGWTMPAWIWEHQIAHFSRHYRVVALDPRSHGDSERVTEGHYPNRLARDIRELAQHLELPPTVLVGWSMGALQVLTAVEQFGTGWLSAVVLVDEVLGYPPNAWIDSRRRGKGRLELQADRKSVTDRFVRGMYERPQPEDYLRRIMAASLRTPTDTAVTLGASFAAVGDWRRILPGIDRPLLFVVTEPQRKQAEGVLSDVPSARVEVFERAGHALFVDEPDRFNRLLEEFLVQAGSGPANTCSLLSRDDWQNQV